MRRLCGLLLLIGMLQGCASLQSPSKYNLATGYYNFKEGKDKVQVFLDAVEDTLVLTKIADETSVIKLPLYTNEGDLKPIRLSKPTLDIDIISALFKLRPRHVSLPPQLNATFNGNIYVGYRKDMYTTQYVKEFKRYRREINHFGFSVGLFGGIGATPVNPSVTQNAIATEYDGIILQKGAAAILAINKITIGLGLGFDTLLDRNAQFWIYQERPWLGLMLGLNLN